MATPDPTGPVEKAPAKAKPDLFRIGRYDLIYVLGRGGMATVYMGQVSGLAGFEKLVTVKVIHQHLAQEQQFVDMFLDEARLTARIQHPNVAATQEVGREGGLLYMVGEFVEGQSLRTVMTKARNRSTRLSHPMAAHVSACVCDGLHAAHELTDEEGRPLNLVHRDISPPNVMISYHGFVKLIDFGVAHARGRLSHTEAGTIKGKMGYLAPEQLQGKVLDRRCDIFALGVMLYEMTSGLHPFPGETGLERLNRIAQGDYRPPRVVEPSIDPKLERIIIKALAHRREDRFESAAEMSAALRQYIASTGVSMGIDETVEVMGWLFPEEIAKHRATVKEFREQNQLLDVSGLDPIDDRIASSVRRPRVSKSSLRLYVAAAALALVVGGSLISLTAWNRLFGHVETFVQVGDDFHFGAPRLAAPQPLNVEVPQPPVAEVPQPSVAEEPQPSVAEEPQPSVPKEPQPLVAEVPQPPVEVAPKAQEAAPLVSPAAKAPDLEPIASAGQPGPAKGTSKGQTAVSRPLPPKDEPVDPGGAKPSLKGSPYE